MHENLLNSKVDTSDDLPSESLTRDKSEIMQGDGAEFKGWFYWFRTSQFSNEICRNARFLHVPHCSNLKMIWLLVGFLHVAMFFLRDASMFDVLLCLFEFPMEILA